MKNFCLSLLLGIAVSTAQASVIPVGHVTNGTINDLAYTKTEIGTRSYFTVQAVASHAVAQQNCRELFGGRLAVVLTNGQELDLQNFVATQSQSYYYRIGGMYQSPRWMWTSLSTPLPVTINGWRAGQPSSNTNMCICANGIGATYGWYSCSCTSGLFYICEG